MNALEELTTEFIEANDREPTREESLEFSRRCFDCSMQANNQIMKAFEFIDCNKNRQVVFAGLFMSGNEADKAFEEATGLNPLRSMFIGRRDKPLTVLDVCMASGMFSSNSEAIKAIKNRGIRVSRVQAEQPKERRLASGRKVLEFEPICLMDFINARLLPHGMDTFKKHGNFITLHFGKTGKILKISPQGIMPIMGT